MLSVLWALTASLQMFRHQAWRSPRPCWLKKSDLGHLTQRKQTNLSVTINPESQDRRATLNAVGYQSQMAR
jgi:hypothetical protein